jgi:hypothetical protein
MTLGPRCARGATGGNATPSSPLPQREGYIGNLGRLLAVDVTTVFSPAGGASDFTQLKTAAAAAPVPRFFGTGPAITVPGASPGQQGLTPSTAADARAVIQKLKAANVDAIKIHRDDVAWASTGRRWACSRMLRRSPNARRHSGTSSGSSRRVST